MPQAAGEPVFAEPWMAQAFAMALQLHQRGLFDWPEFATSLAEAIDAARRAGDAGLGDTYYHHWLSALESLVVAKGAGSAADLLRLRAAWAHAVHRTPHGAPIELRSEDFPG
jgi:nitrile hydratase accessory protein